MVMTVVLTEGSGERGDVSCQSEVSEVMGVRGEDSWVMVMDEKEQELMVWDPSFIRNCNKILMR